MNIPAPDVLMPTPCPDRHEQQRAAGRSQSRRRVKRRVVLCLLLLTMFLAPFMIGGGPEWATTVTLACSLVLGFVFLALRPEALRVVPLAGVGALAAAVTALQLVPLPLKLVRALSPEAVAVRSAVALGGTAPALLPITLDVPATVIELAKTVAYLAIFLITAAVARRTSDAKRLLLALALLGAAVAATTLLHRALGAQTIFGLYRVREQPGLGFFAPFVNGNNAAALLVMTSLIALGLALQTSGLIRWLSLASLGLGLFVLPMTGARASFAGLAGGAIALGSRLLSLRFGWLKAVVITSFLVTLVGVPLVFANQVLKHRLSGGLPAFANNQKTRGWRDSVDLIAHYRLVGVGRGAFESPISTYRKASEGIRLRYVESLPLQLASEYGLPLIAVLVGASALAIRKVLRRALDAETSVQAAAFALAALIFQELASFSLELTGVAIPAAITAGVVVGRTQQRRRAVGQQLSAHHMKWWLAALAAWTLSFGSAVWALPRTLWAEGEELRRIVMAGASARDALDAAMTRHPADPYLAFLAHLEARRRDPQRAEFHLKRAQKLYPADGKLHQAWARWLVQQKRPAEAALAFRQAAEVGVSTKLDELFQLLEGHLVAEAVPQTQRDLMAVAGVMVQRQRVDLAEAISARAVINATSKEAAAIERVSLAMRVGASDFLGVAAEDLLLLATQPFSFSAAAQALQKAGLEAKADAAIDIGLSRHPHDGALLLESVRLLLQRGDLPQARARLRAQSDSNLTLQEQIQAKTLAATIAERQGDLVGAVTARAQARMMSESLSESSGMGR